MRSNSGLERFQRSSVSHNNLSATRFRVDIGINPLKGLGSAGQLATSSPRWQAIVGRMACQFQSKRPHTKSGRLFINALRTTRSTSILGLSCEIERAKLYSISAPILERRARCDLEFVIARL